jgi:flagellar biosynthesis chaperone FliJ
MKTPFDAVLRLRQREIDAMRLSISAEVNQLENIGRQHHAINASLRDEADLAASDWRFAAPAFGERLRAQRAQLLRDATVVVSRLGGLRREAAKAYGEMAAMEGAADRFRSEADQVVAKAEQAQIDDFSAARFNRMKGIVARSVAHKELSGA